MKSPLSPQWRGGTCVFKRGGRPPQLCCGGRPLIFLRFVVFVKFVVYSAPTVNICSPYSTEKFNSFHFPFLRFVVFIKFVVYSAPTVNICSPHSPEKSICKSMTFLFHFRKKVFSFLTISVTIGRAL